MRFPTTRQQILAAIFPSVDPDPQSEPQGGGTVDPAPAAGDGDDNSPDKLMEALRKERQLRKAEAARAAQLEAQMKEVGQVNPQLVAEAQAKAQAAEQQRLLIEQQTANRLAEQERKFQEQLARVTGEMQTARQAAEREALRVKTQAEFLASKGLAEASSIDGRTPFDYIWQLFGNSFAEDKNGLYVVDADGDPVMDEESGKRLTAREYFARLRKDPVHGMHFQPEYGSGSGARGSRDGRVSTTADLSKVPTSQLFRESFGSKRQR
jgi:hypothetical protein